MKQLDNLNVNNNFDIIELGQVTLCPSPTTVPWKLTLPPDDGTTGQFLTTDGSGVTTWAPQAASSITFTGPGTGFTVTGSPGDSITLSYDGVIPTASFQTGGTWFPAFTNAGATPTYTKQTGAWVRIGDICVLSIEFVASATTVGASETIKITGPTNIGGNGGFNQDMIIAGSSSSTGAGGPFYMRIGGGNNDLQPHDSTSVALKSAANAWDGSFIATITYRCETI